MTAAPNSGARDALRERFDKRRLWTRYLRLATRATRMGELEAAVWEAVAWYADSPSRTSELELKRAARAFGIEPPAAPRRAVNSDPASTTISCIDNP